MKVPTPVGSEDPSMTDRTTALVRAARPRATRGTLEIGALKATCALGRAGIRVHKSEGDGVTPAGLWPIRRVLYRADKVALPPLPYPTRAIDPCDGWCDAPDDPLYNRPVQHPYPASAEHLWRCDDLYDIVVVLGHNDDPPIAGYGSAIFLHIAGADYGPTAGCVALDRADLTALLTHAPAVHALRIDAA